MTDTSVIITWFTGPTTEVETYGFRLPVTAGTALQIGLVGLTTLTVVPAALKTALESPAQSPEPEHEPRTVTMTAAPNAQLSRPAPPEHCSTTPKTPAHGAHLNRFPTPVTGRLARCHLILLVRACVSSSRPGAEEPLSVRGVIVTVN